MTCPPIVRRTLYFHELVAVGAGLNARDRYGNTPLHNAARYNENLAVINVLLCRRGSEHQK